MACNKNWTKDEDKLLGIGLPDSEVARVIDRSEGAVKARRQRLRIPITERWDRYSEREDELLIKLWNEWPRTHIARVLHRSVGSVYARAKRLRL